jgi:hypothetical protein
MATLTSANAVAAIPKMVAPMALQALFPNFVMGGFVNRDFDNVLASAGDTVNVAMAPNLVANNIAEAGSVQTQSPSLGNAQVVLNTHAEATFQIPNVMQALAAPDLIATYLQPAAVAVAEKIEADLLSVYVLLTANAAVGTGGTAPTEATVDSAETALFKARMPDATAKIGVVSPDCYASLRQISRFSEDRMVAGAGQSAIYNGTIGKLKNITFVRSQKVTVSGGTTYNMVFGRDAIVLVTRALPTIIQGTGAVSYMINLAGFGMRVVMSYNPNTLGQQFTIDVLYGVGILRNQFGTQLLS